MSDQNQNPVDAGTDNPDGKQRNGGDNTDYEKTEIKKIAEQRDEAKRKALELEGQLAKLQEDKLKEQNRYMELYESEKQKNGTFQEKISQLEVKSQKLDEIYSMQKERIKTALGDKWKPTFDNLDLTALENIAEIALGSSHLHTPPNGGSGGGGKQKDPKDMTEAEYFAYRKDKDKK